MRISLGQSLGHKFDALAEQIAEECRFFADEDEMVDDLAERLEYFIVILQQKAGFSDEQIKEAISDFCIRPGKDDLKSWHKLQVSH